MDEQQQQLNMESLISGVKQLADAAKRIKEIQEQAELSATENFIYQRAYDKRMAELMKGGE